MAIRILGNSTVNPTGFRLAKKRDDNPTGSVSSGVESVAGIEHKSNGDDNVDESNASGQTDFIDPESIDTGDSGSSGRTYTGKRRGRKPGSTNKRGPTNRTSTSKTTDSVAAMLFTVHSVAGSLLKMKSIQIPKASCNDLAQAILNVSELYEVPLLDEKGMAWANLAAVACKVYIFNGKADVVRDDDHKNVTVISQPIAVPDFMRG